MPQTGSVANRSDDGAVGVVQHHGGAAREAHDERGAAVDLALHADRAAVLLDDLARAGEADAGAGDASLDVRAALKALEDALLVGAGDAHAAVAHAEHHLAVLHLEPDVDLAAVGRILDRVADE